MSPHLAHVLTTVATMLQLISSPTTLVQGQSLGARHDARAAYRITTIHDRVTDSTRVSAVLRRSSGPFGLESRVWLDASFTYSGSEMTTPPAFVVLSLESFTPSRGGWAFARPKQLRIESGHHVLLESPASGYERRPVHLLDRGRREVLWFEIPVAEFVRLGAESELVLKAGSASIRIREPAMEMVRDLSRRMTSMERRPQ